MRKRIILGTVLFLLLAFIAYGFARPGASSDADSVRVSFTRKAGFSPAIVHIKQGGTVTFAGMEDIWPASDPHPDHVSYSVFDPRKPIKQGESWSFKFDREGVWNYHDHLNPIFKGTVIVGNATQKAISSDYKVAAKDCAGLDDAQCYNEIIKRVVAVDGLAKGFEAFDYLYKTEPGFVKQGCHWAAHIVGESAYAEFARGKKLAFTDATSYCGYGFFHGFIESLLHTDPNLDKVKELCVKVGEELGKDRPDARLNCFHGIGHGFVEDPPPPSHWLKPDLILQTSFDACEHISDDPNEVGQCYEGGFNGIGTLPLAQSGFSFEDGKALSFCRSQPLARKVHCYYEFTQMLKVPDQKVEAIAGFMGLIEEPYREMSVNSMAAGIVQKRIGDADQSYGVSGCKALGAYAEACIRGIVGGYFAHGEPDKEFEKSLAYCGDSRFSAGQKEACYGQMISASQKFYTKAFIEEKVCARFEAPYRTLCSPTK